MPFRFERDRTTDRVPEFCGILDDPVYAYAKGKFGEVVVIGNPDSRYNRLVLAQEVGNQKVDKLVVISLFSRLAGGGARIIPVTETGMKQPLNESRSNWEEASREVTTVYGQGLYLVEEPLEARLSQTAGIAADYFDYVASHSSTVVKSS